MGHTLGTYSSSSVFCHTAGPWQSNSAPLPVLGSSLQVSVQFVLHQLINHTSPLSTSSPLALYFLIHNFFHQPILYHYMPYPIFLSSNYCFNHRPFLSHPAQDLFICYLFRPTNAFNPSPYLHFQWFFFLISSFLRDHVSALYMILYLACRPVYKRVLGEFLTSTQLVGAWTSKITEVLVCQVVTTHELRYRPNPKWPPSAIMKFQLFYFLEYMQPLI